MNRDYWMYNTSRFSQFYIEGVQTFIRVAEENRLEKGSGSICCPCNVCKNFKTFNCTEEIEYHLLQNGFVPNYTCWSRHGETLLDCSTSSTNLHINNSTCNKDSYVVDDDHQSNDPNDNFNEMFDDMEANMGDVEQEKLHDLFEEAETPLYSGCKFMKLDVVLRLMNLKSKNGWSDKSFTSLLVFLHDILPEDNALPISTYQAKKLMCPMGLEVERIHACPNNCMLYRKEFENKHNCVFCGASRYKRKKDLDEVDDDVTKNGPPAKMLWYLPIIPRLKRLFSNEKEAKLLCWHSEERETDRKLRHVADSPQWRNIDKKYPEFGKEMRNIRFGLSSDGINPFGNISSRHSTWLVLLCIYNLPPWLCMKRKYIMMSLLIQGPRQPSNDIDVYLSPLIDDLKTLWSSGVDVYDAYKKQHFQLRAMIFCTISDFPAYGNLSGYKTKGKKACPICEDQTSSIWLKNCKKTVYMGHRRFLPKSHRFRKKTIEFDGSIEIRTMRKRFDAFSRVASINVVLGKRFRVDKDALWKKKSIFFELPYWRHLDVRHCLDVMHIEKNVCESLICLLLGMMHKTREFNIRKDMVEMGIREDLAPEQSANRVYLPAACYTTSKEEKIKFCQCLHDIKVPSTYSANIKRFVSMKDCKLFGMKSHDCHVLMTHMIPIAIRGILQDDVRHSITKLCLFFNNIHSKVIDIEDLDKWEKDVYVTLCELEMHFPPSFFDIMVHLISHIVQEIKACGPVFLRYMYPFERYMGILKGYVRNRNRLEGSIVEGYTFEEVIEFCQGYMKDVESVGVPKTRHSGRLEGKGRVGLKITMPTYEELQVAHLVVLKHMKCLTPYIDEHMDMLKSKYPGKEQMWYINNHNKEFSRWLKNKVAETNVDETVKRLGHGPDCRVKSYEGYDINGYTFYTKDQDQKSTMQNSGVTMIASTTEFDRRDHDTLIRIAKDSYYGVIQNIWELNYFDFVIPVFKCKWVNNRTGVQVDKDGFTLVDLTTNGYASEPFVLAKHVTQVFYVKDPSKQKEHIVLQGKRRIVGVDNVVDEEEYDHFDDLPPFSVSIEPDNYDNVECTTFVRSNIEGTYVD
ncbi:hypothetical protein Lser_V15G35834 [Lactuca serriola]